MKRLMTVSLALKSGNLHFTGQPAMHADTHGKGNGHGNGKDKGGGHGRGHNK